MNNLNEFLHKLSEKYENNLIILSFACETSTHILS